MPDRVQLVGLDFGTTTSSAVVASARLLHNSVTGRMEIDQVEEVLRSPMVFTPLVNDRLNLAAMEQHLDTWLAPVRDEELFGGGALLTGLTARTANAQALVGLVRRRLGNALVAVADDPCLESWLAFQGSAAGLSRARPDMPILNLDIGGGTTNLALGLNGEVLRTGCLFVGARHFQVAPGSYRLVRLSSFAQVLLQRLGIKKGTGDTLALGEIEAIVDYYTSLLDRTLAGAAPADSVDRLHTQVELHLPALPNRPVMTLSGGVGELVYGAIAGQPWPATTAFGDLGIDLARRILEHPRWRDDLRQVVPAAGGRATVYGLLRHSTEVSGSTIFLARPESLPLLDLPIVGTVTLETPSEQMAALLHLVQRSIRGGCLYVTLRDVGAEAVRTLGRRIADELRKMSFPADHPLVLVVRDNVGKALGQYVTGWGETSCNLTVIDEVRLRDAQ